ncbi:MAG: diadenylate cyclase CdaA [Anaerolineales bacterium]|nr:diadenylate cyclase CdaA [Anaerolineales bacterium]MCW5856590.1 diadenylate cyclase CdaA [Anaerolineales bacterium]
MSQLLDEILFILQRLSFASVVDLLLVTAIVYAGLSFLRNTRAMVLLRGILVLYVLISLLIVVFNLPAFSWLVRNSLPAILVAIPVIFATEIRRALERLGRASQILTSANNNDHSPDVISAITQAALRLSEKRHGALIVLQRLDSLEEYVDTGVLLDAQVSPSLLLQIFHPNTPLHDGAVIIMDTRIAGAACVMPLSTSGVLSPGAERQMGLRHRAALGTSEVSDAVSLVISEETGAISIAFGGRMIHRLGRERLDGVLRAFYRPVQPSNSFEQFIARYLPFLLSEQRDSEA